MKNQRQTLQIILPILIVVLLGVSAFSCWSIYQLIETIKYQNHSLAIQTKLNNLNGLLQDVETEAQANLLLGDDDARSDSTLTIEKIPVRLKELKALIRSDHRQLETFSQVEGVVLERVHRLAQQIEMGPLTGDQIAEALRSYRKGVILNHLIQRGLQEMDLRESVELNTHERKVKLYSESAIQLIAVGTILTIALILLFAFLAYTEIQRRNRLLDDLSHAREAASVASKLKSQFLATVSHEIRTPLNGIIGFSELLKNRIRDVEQKNMVALIHQSGQSLLKIVNDILDFSKVEAGKLDFEISDFSIPQVVGSAIELLSLKTRQKGLTVMSYIDGALPLTVRGDASRLSQILQNLVNNALKFTESGGVFIKVVPHGQREAGEVIVRFEIQDTGMGISSEEQKLLFQPFNQLKRSEGTGLGLSICKNLVEQMNGRIGVESFIEKGSTFWFELPLPRSSSQNISQQKIDLAAKNKKIKVVSKCSTVRKALGSYFSEWGLSCDFVEHSTRVNDENTFVIIDALKWTVQELRDQMDQNSASGCLYLVSSGLEKEKTQDLSDISILKVPFGREQLLTALHRGLSVQPLPAELQKILPKARGGLVLLAEDNPVNQALAEMYVERLGYKVHSVVNGREVLEAIEHVQYSLVLMDVQMPVMDGIETTRRIRELESKTGRHLPIVAMTANAIAGDRERCLAAGMDDYLAKPFQEHELAQTFGNVLGQDSKDLINWSVLRDLSSKTNPQTVKKLIESFITTLQKALKNLEVDINSHNLEHIRFAVHQLKSSSQSLGAQTLAAMCAEIESQVHEKSEPSQILAQTQKLVDHGYKVLSGFLERSYFESGA